MRQRQEKRKEGFESTLSVVLASVRTVAVIVIIVASLLLNATVSWAQSGPSPDPIDQLPANNDVNDATDNTDVGLLQVEIGGQFTYTASGTQSVGSPFTARYGVFEWLEVSFGADGYLEQTDQGAQAVGFGNLQAGARLRLFGGAGGLPVISLIPQLVIPTASPAAGLGTGDVDFTLGILTGKDLPHSSHVDVAYGVGAIGEGAGLGRFNQQTATVSGSLGVTPAWTPGATLAWVSKQDVDTGAAWTLAGESVLTASRRVAFDVSVQMGLNRSAPDLELAGGVSFVVGELDLDQGVHARRHHLRFRPRHHRPS